MCCICLFKCSLRSWQFCLRRVKRLGGEAASAREKPVFQPLPPHSSRGFAAKTFDPVQTKPPATQASLNDKLKIIDQLIQLFDY